MRGEVREVAIEGREAVDPVLLPSGVCWHRWIQQEQEHPAKDVLAQDPGTWCDLQTGPANAVGIDGRHGGDCKPRNSLQPTLFIHPAASCHENHLRYLETAAPVSYVLEIVAVPAVN
jgi:hypothetical protein